MGDILAVRMGGGNSGMQGQRHCIFPGGKCKSNRCRTFCLSLAHAGGTAVPGEKTIPRRTGIVQALGTLHPAEIRSEKF